MESTGERKRKHVLCMHDEHHESLSSFFLSLDLLFADDNSCAKDDLHLCTSVTNQWSTYKMLRYRKFDELVTSARHFHFQTLI